MLFIMLSYGNTQGVNDEAAYEFTQHWHMSLCTYYEFMQHWWTLNIPQELVHMKPGPQPTAILGGAETFRKQSLVQRT